MKIKEIAFEKRVLLSALIIDVLAAAVSFFMGKTSWGFGFLYGYLITAGNFIVMSLATKRLVQMEPEGAKIAAIGSYFGRMVFISVAIIMLKFWTAINVWAAMIGFFSVRIAILFEAFFTGSQGEKR